MSESAPAREARDPVVDAWRAYERGERETVLIWVKDEPKYINGPPLDEPAKRTGEARVVARAGVWAVLQWWDDEDETQRHSLTLGPTGLAAAEGTQAELLDLLARIEGLGPDACADADIPLGGPGARRVRDIIVRWKSERDEEKRAPIYIATDPFSGDEEQRS